MQTGYELIAPAEGEWDPTPTDLQRALTSKPMRLHPATCAVCDDFGALCDQIEGREGQHTTQSLSGVDRTDQRRLQLDAMGLVIQEVLFNGIISNDKCCCTRWGVLQRSWWRRPHRLRRSPHGEGILLRLELTRRRRDP